MKKNISKNIGEICECVSLKRLYDETSIHEKRYRSYRMEGVDTLEGDSHLTRAYKDAVMRLDKSKNRYYSMLTSMIKRKDVQVKRIDDKDEINCRKCRKSYTDEILIRSLG